MSRKRLQKKLPISFSEKLSILVARATLISRMTIPESKVFSEDILNKVMRSFRNYKNIEFYDDEPVVPTQIIIELYFDSFEDLFNELPEMVHSMSSWSDEDLIEEAIKHSKYNSVDFITELHKSFLEEEFLHKLCKYLNNR